MVDKNCLYTKTHEWIRIEGEFGFIGITDHAQEELGEIVYLELPGEGDNVTAGKAFGTIETAKSASDLNAPVSGEVVEVNSGLNDDFAPIKESPYGDGWMIKVRLSNPGETGGLLSPDQYEATI